VEDALGHKKLGIKKRTMESLILAQDER
jgi:hypothetical protein